MTTKLLLPVIFLLFIANFSKGQEISGVYTTTKDDQIIIHYNLSKVKYFQSLEVTAYVSFDGGKTFQGPLKAVSGDVGNNIKGGERTITWSPFEEYNSLEGELIFDVRCKINNEVRKRSFFLNYSPNVLFTNTNYRALYGIQIGQVGKTGWYLAARKSDFSKPGYTFDGETITPLNPDLTYKQFTGNMSFQRLMLTGGFTFQMGWNSFFYLGAGYGSTQVNWQFKEYNYDSTKPVKTDWAKVKQYDKKGAEAELGFIFKAMHVSYSFGATVNQYAKVGAVAGIGINF